MRQTYQKCKTTRYVGTRGYPPAVRVIQLAAAQWLVLDGQVRPRFLIVKGPMVDRATGETHRPVPLLDVLRPASAQQQLRGLCALAGLDPLGTGPGSQPLVFEPL